MSAIHTKSLGASGAEVLVAQSEAVSMSGQKEEGLAVDAVLEVIASSGTGQLSITDETNGDSAVFSLHQASDASVIAKSYGSALIGDTKDNAATINVYVEGGVVKIQNKLAAAVDINVKAYI